MVKKRTRPKGGNTKGQKASVAKVESTVRRLEALDFRLMGLCYRSIGEQMSISAQAAHKLVTKALQDLNTLLDEKAEEVRRLDLERIDKMMFALWPRALRGDLPAIGMIVRLMERKGKIKGTDAPTVINWRKEAEERGVDVPGSFEKMVQFFHEQLKADAESE